MSGAQPTGFLRTVLSLLRAARTRSVGRARRQRALLSQRKRSGTDSLGMFGTIMVFLAMAMVHAVLGHQAHTVIEAATRLDLERGGKIVVTSGFVRELKKSLDHRTSPVIPDEALLRHEEVGGTKEEQEQILRAQLAAHGPAGFIGDNDPAFEQPRTPLAMAVGALLLVWWFVMMAFQGEGLEVDYQKRRHPMWEWLFSHPIRPSAAFFAEMLTPMAANPVFVTAPVFWVLLFVNWHPWPQSIAAAVLIGLPIAIAASCTSKTAEIVCMLRLSPRSRGAVLGLLSWMGYASLMLAFMSLGLSSNTLLLTSILQPLEPLFGGWHLPVFGWALGMRPDGTMSLAAAVIAGWLFAALLIAICVWQSGRATRLGLAGGFGGSTKIVTVRESVSTGRPLLRDPLLRKELLWFWRDRGAVVQAILIPLTIGLMQAYNLRGVAARATEAWYSMCGLAVICGTYFLLVLGPRSLMSEGPALWITLTWPRGLESLLKAKALLWSLLATVLVGMVMIYSMVKFPADAWKAALVTIGWCFFARSLGQKTVTLVTVPSPSGEPTPVPQGRRWAAMLGTFSFAAGIMSQNWQLAIMGVVFSSLSAAAMWQNFRARIPYLYDPWSERLPPPPTLMHAMIGITGMLDGMALIALVLIFILGKSERALAASAAYGLAAIATWWIMRCFLKGRDVPPSAVWRWQDHDARFLGNPIRLLDRIDWKRRSPVVVFAFLGALALALLAVGYRWSILKLPGVREYAEKSLPNLGQDQFARLSLIFLAVICAPLAEEYLFRGLLYRALDREWGGWKAVFGSAVFFGIYHPPLSWPLVILFGAFNAWLFKRSGRLAPCVLAHLSYNATVLLLP